METPVKTRHDHCAALEVSAADDPSNPPGSRGYGATSSLAANLLGAFAVSYRLHAIAKMAPQSQNSTQADESGSKKECLLSWAFVKAFQAFAE